MVCVRVGTLRWEQSLGLNRPCAGGRGVLPATLPVTGPLLLSFPCSGAGEEQRLLALVGRLEQELGHLKADLSSWQHGQASCEKVDAIHEKVSASVFMFCHGK